MCTLFASRWIAYVRSRIRQLLIRLLEEVIITDKYCFYIGYRLGYILTVYIYINIPMLSVSSTYRSLQFRCKVGYILTVYIYIYTYAICF